MRGASRAVTWSGTLDAAVEPGEPQPEPELIGEVREVRAGRGDVDRVVRLFRESTVWVETEADGDRHALRVVPAEGLTWLPVFSSLPNLAAFCQASGRGEIEVSYGTLTGAQAIEVCLPELPTGTGLVLDAASDHVLSLPPVRGVVPDFLAVDRDETPPPGER